MILLLLLLLYVLIQDIMKTRGITTIMATKSMDRGLIRWKWF